MNISIRKGRIEDLPRLLEIEASAIPGYGYLDGVKEEFFDNSRGELIVAETDGLPIGFARFTLEYDGSAWLEILRVHKDWQRKGCGRAIWARFMELAAQYRVPAMRMYTGEKNIASRSLAEQHGLHVAWHTVEGVLMRENLPADAAHADAADGFVRIADPAAVGALMAPFAEDYHHYTSTNRTYYALNDALYAGLSKDFDVWAKGDSVLITGARFLPERGINILCMGGDLTACAAKAMALLSASDKPRLVAMVSEEDAARQTALESAGFVFTRPGIIMLERTF